MNTLITIGCLAWAVLPSAIANIFAYPVSKRLSCLISEHIAKFVAYRVFAILNCYRHFHFFGYKETKKGLPAQFAIVSNHQSLIDIPAFMRFFRDKDVRFVAKDNLARHVPLVSEMLRAHEHCMIPRNGNSIKAMKAIEDFGARVLKRGQIPVIFPEGTRSKDGRVGRFHSAGYRKLNEATRLPVACCAIDGGWQIRDVRHMLTNLKNGCYRVKVLKLFPAPTTKAEEEALLAECKALIQKQLDEWSLLSTDCKY